MEKNVDMNASTAAVYESKTSGIVNALHALLDKAEKSVWCRNKDDDCKNKRRDST